MPRNLQKLTEREKRFCIEFVSGESMGNATQSYLKIAPKIKRTSAGLLAQQMLKRPRVLMEVERLRNEAGLDDDTVMEKIQEGLTATQVTAYRGRIYGSNHPDFAVRERYLKLYARIKGLIAPSKVEKKTLNIDVQLEKLSPNEIATLLQKTAAKINARQRGENRLLETTSEASE